MSKFTDAVSSALSGQFVSISGYQNSHGEVADVTFHVDANYDSVHERSLAELDRIAANPVFAVPVTYHTWVDAKGEEFNRKAGGRTLEKKTVTVSHGDPRLAAAIEKVRQSITAPKKQGTQWDVQLAKSVYEQDDRVYFSNVLVHSKKVIVEGEYPVSATTLDVALTKALKELLPIGQYRTYVLEDNFDYVSVAGQKITRV